nr:transposase [Staphylococcus aureus]
MTQVHFTLKSEEIQSIIEYSVKDDVSKNILTTVFNQLMENQRTEYIQAKEYERTENRQSQRNGYYERSFTTRVGTLELKVPRTRDGHFSPTVFERYQRNEKALMASMLEMYVSGVSTRKVSKIVEELCGKSVSKSFVSSLTEQLELWLTSGRIVYYQKKISYLMTDVLYKSTRRKSSTLKKLSYSDWNNQRWRP